jgi:hypothetical protein
MPTCMVIIPLTLLLAYKKVNKTLVNLIWLITIVWCFFGCVWSKDISRYEGMGTARIIFRGGRETRTFSY